jgi:hypothetical protein
MNDGAIHGLPRLLLVVLFPFYVTLVRCTCHKICHSITALDEISVRHLLNR